MKMRCGDSKTCWHVIRTVSLRTTRAIGWATHYHYEKGDWQRARNKRYSGPKAASNA